MQENFRILSQRAALYHSTFPVNLDYSVTKYTSRTPCLHAYSCSQFVCTVTFITQHAWLKVKFYCVPKQITHPHVMVHSLLHATLGTSSQSVSFFHLSCVVVVIFPEPRLVVHVSNNPLWRSTAGRYFHGIPLLHRL